jgi:hypothetical protein
MLLVIGQWLLVPRERNALGYLALGLVENSFGFWTMSSTTTITASRDRPPKRSIVGSNRKPRNVCAGQESPGTAHRLREFDQEWDIERVLSEGHSQARASFALSAARL